MFVDLLNDPSSVKLNPTSVLIMVRRKTDQIFDIFQK